MKKLLAVVLGLSLMSGISLKAYAQEATPAPNVQKPNAADMQAKREKFKELRDMMDSFRKEEQPLRDQMKVEMAKVKELRDQMKAMRDEHKKAMDAKRAELGLPAIPEPKARIKAPTVPAAPAQ